MRTKIGQFQAYPNGYYELIDSRNVNTIRENYSRLRRITTIRDNPFLKNLYSACIHSAYCDEHISSYLYNKIIDLKCEIEAYADSIKYTVLDLEYESEDSDYAD